MDLWSEAVCQVLRVCSPAALPRPDRACPGGRLRCRRSVRAFVAQPVDAAVAHRPRRGRRCNEKPRAGLAPGAQIDHLTSACTWWRRESVAQQVAGDPVSPVGPVLRIILAQAVPDSSSGRMRPARAAAGHRGGLAGRPEGARSRQNLECRVEASWFSGQGAPLAPRCLAPTSSRADGNGPSRKWTGRSCASAGSERRRLRATPENRTHPYVRQCNGGSAGGVLTLRLTIDKPTHP